MAAIVYTVLDAIITCGVDNATLFNGHTVAQRVAEELFDNDFHACIDKRMTAKWEKTSKLMLVPLLLKVRFGSCQE